MSRRPAPLTVDADVIRIDFQDGDDPIVAKAGKLYPMGMSGGVEFRLEGQKVLVGGTSAPAEPPNNFFEVMPGPVFVTRDKYNLLEEREENDPEVMAAPEGFRETPVVDRKVMASVLVGKIYEFLYDRNEVMRLDQAFCAVEARFEANRLHLGRDHRATWGRPWDDVES